MQQIHVGDPMDDLRFDGYDRIRIVLDGGYEFVIEQHDNDGLLITAPESLDALPKDPSRHNNVIVRYHFVRHRA